MMYLVPFLTLLYAPLFWWVDKATGSYPDWTRFLDIISWLLVAWIIYALCYSRRYLQFSLFAVFFISFHFAWYVKLHATEALLEFDDFSRGLQLLSLFGVPLTLIHYMPLIMGIGVVSFLYAIRSSIHVKHLFISLLVSIFFVLGNIFYVGNIGKLLNFQDGYQRKNGFRSGQFYYTLFQQFERLHFQWLYSPNCDLLHHVPTATQHQKIHAQSVYVIMVESLFDLASLPTEKFDQDPFFTPFRNVLDISERKGKHSYMEVGIRGGGSASSEFEALCGMPSTLLSNTSGSEFSYLMSHRMECLPQILNTYGFKTAAFYPSPVQFFNERKAYELAGFQESFFLQDLQANDLEGGGLSDESLFAQMVAWRKKQPPEQPVFMYAMTTASHFPHKLSDRRPFVISGKNASANVKLANRYYYTTKELYEFIEEVKKIDPGSIIIALGDHRPPEYDQFSSSENFAELTEVFRTVFSDFGTLMHYPKFPAPYFIPSAIMNSLGIALPDAMLKFAKQEKEALRPLAGLPSVWINTDGDITSNDRIEGDKKETVTYWRDIEAQELFCQPR